VRREAQQLGVEDGGPVGLRPDDRRLHPVEQHRAGHATERHERLVQATEHRQLVLRKAEPHPQHARPTHDDQQRVDRAKGRGERGDAQRAPDLGLVPRHHLEPRLERER